jgi:hypothetical protein
VSVHKRNLPAVGWRPFTPPTTVPGTGNGAARSRASQTLLASQPAAACQRHAITAALDVLDRGGTLARARRAYGAVADRWFAPESQPGRGGTPPVTARRDAEAAAEVCRQVCPMQLACFEYAVAIRAGHGIWGGVQAPFRPGNVDKLRRQVVLDVARKARRSA